VLFLDIVEYSRKPVAEQIRLKDRFNGLIASAIREISPADRIIMDTGDGVAISFLGDPEDALFVAMSLRDAFTPDKDQPSDVPARIGVNLGPVRLVRDLNGRPNIIGDGINVAQRVMAFADAGQILVSRSYYEMVSHISEGYTKLFTYQGSRTDKHVREHEIYSVGFSMTEVPMKSPAERARRGASEALGRSTAGSATTARLLFRFESWLGNRSIAYATAAFSALAFVLALVTSLVSEAPLADTQQQNAPTTAETPQGTVTGTGNVATTEPDLIANEATRSQSAGANQPATASGVASTDSGRDSNANSGSMSPAAPATDSAPTPVQPAQESGNTTTAAVAGTSQPTQTTEGTPVPAANTGGGPAGSGRASISLAITPWGEVFVDGKPIGVSPPLNEIELLPGSRLIEFRNGDFPPYRQRVELKAGQKFRIRYKFN
jgi:hypothetical protein